MRPFPSILAFALIALFAVGQVTWWTIVLTGDAARVEGAARALEIGDVDGATTAMGADSAAGLRELATSRRTMFLAEGIAFLIATTAGAWLYVSAVRRERRTSREHDNFLAAATHELKTPIATLRLGLQSLEAQQHDASAPVDHQHRRQRYLRDMLGELARLEGGLTNILTAAGLRSAPRAQRVVEGDVAEDVRAAVREVEPRAVAAGVALDADGVTPCPGTRDPEAIRIIAHNLLDNAVKHSRSGDRVRVTLAAEGATARLEIEDSGIGFDPAAAARLFEPFYQGADHARGGIGLGLHLVHELTHAHGGSVEAHSDGPGRGARFAVRLPRGLEASP